MIESVLAPVLHTDRYTTLGAHTNNNDVLNSSDFVANCGQERPIHLLGIGDPESVERLIASGMDTVDGTTTCFSDPIRQFDSAYPTRCGRHGTLFLTTNNVSSTSIEWN